MDGSEKLHFNGAFSEIHGPGDFSNAQIVPETQLQCSALSRRQTGGGFPDRAHGISSQDFRLRKPAGAWKLITQVRIDPQGVLPGPAALAV